MAFDIALVIEIVAGITTDAIAKNLDRNETVVRVLQRLNIERLPANSDFETLYVYSLVEYGVFKPKSVLNFFRNKFIHDAFHRAFCIIRAMPIRNSGACRSPIPFHADR